ncbi:hypothetical protein HOG98_01435 [bacterium]|nr:hypothetical protein [bacterium]
MRLFYKIVSFSFFNNFKPKPDGPDKSFLFSKQAEPIVPNLLTNMGRMVPFLTNANALNNLEDVKQNVLAHLSESDGSDNSLSFFTEDEIEKFLTSTDVSYICMFSSRIIDLFDDSIVPRALKEEIHRKFSVLEASTTPYFRVDSFTTLYNTYILLLLNAKFENSSQVVAALNVYPLLANFSCEDGGKTELEAATLHINGHPIEKRLLGTIEQFILKESLCDGVDDMYPIHVPKGLRIMLGGEKEKIVKIDQWGYGALRGVSAGKLFRLYDYIHTMFRDDCQTLSSELSQPSFDGDMKDKIERSLIFYGIDLGDYQLAFVEAKIDDNLYPVYLDRSIENLFLIIRESGDIAVQSLYLDNEKNMEDVDSYIFSLLKWYGYIFEKENGHVAVTSYEYWASNSNLENDAELKEKIYRDCDLPSIAGRLDKDSISSLFNLVLPSFYLYEKVDKYMEKLTTVLMQSSWVHSSEDVTSKLSITSYNDFFNIDKSELVIQELKDCLLDYSTGDDVSEADVGKSLFILHVLAEQCRDSSHAIAIDIFRTVTPDVLEAIKTRATHSVFIAAKVDHVKERYDVIEKQDGCNLLLWFIGDVLSADLLGGEDLLNTLIRLNAPPKLFEKYSQQEVAKRIENGVSGVSKRTIYSEILGKKVSSIGVCFYLNPVTVTFLMDRVDGFSLQNKLDLVTSINVDNISDAPLISGLQEIKYRDPDYFQRYMNDASFLRLIDAKNLLDVYVIDPGNDKILRHIFSRSKDDILSFLNSRNDLTKTDYPVFVALEQDKLQLFRYLLAPTIVKKLGREAIDCQFGINRCGDLAKERLKLSENLTVIELAVKTDCIPVLRALFSPTIVNEIDSLFLIENGLSGEISVDFFNRYQQLITGCLLNDGVMKRTDYLFILSEPNFRDGLFRSENGKAPLILSLISDASFLETVGIDWLKNLISRGQHLIEDAGIEETSGDIETVASSNLGGRATSEKLIKGQLHFLRYLMSEEGHRLFSKDWIEGAVNRAFSEFNSYMTSLGSLSRIDGMIFDFSFFEVINMLLKKDLADVVTKKKAIDCLSSGMAIVSLLNEFSEMEWENSMSLLLSVETIRLFGTDNIDRVLSKMPSDKLLDYLYGNEYETSFLKRCIEDSEFIDECGKEWVRTIVFSAKKELENPGYMGHLLVTSKRPVFEILLKQDYLSFFGKKSVTHQLESICLGWHRSVQNEIKFCRKEIAKNDVVTKKDEDNFVEVETDTEHSFINGLGYLISDSGIQALGTETIMQILRKASFVWRYKETKVVTQEYASRRRITTVKEQINKQTYMSFFQMVLQPSVLTNFGSKYISEIFNFRYENKKSIWPLNEISYVTEYRNLIDQLMSEETVHAIGSELTTKIIKGMFVDSSFGGIGEEGDTQWVLSKLLSVNVVKCLGRENIMSILLQFKNDRFLSALCYVSDEPSLLMKLISDPKFLSVMGGAGMRSFLELLRDFSSSMNLSIKMFGGGELIFKSLMSDAMSQTVGRPYIINFVKSRCDSCLSCEYNVPFDDVFIGLFSFLLDADVVDQLGNEYVFMCFNDLVNNNVKELFDATRFRFIEILLLEGSVSKLGDKIFLNMLNGLNRSEFIDMICAQRINQDGELSPPLLDDLVKTFGQEGSFFGALGQKGSRVFVEYITGCTFSKDEQQKDGLVTFPPVPEYDMLLDPRVCRDSLLILELLLSPDAISFFGKDFSVDIATQYIQRTSYKELEWMKLTAYRVTQYVLTVDVIDRLGLDNVMSLLKNIRFGYGEDKDVSVNGHGYLFQRALQPEISKKLGRDNLVDIFSLFNRLEKSIWPLNGACEDTRLEVFNLLLSENTVSILGSEMVIHLLSCSAQELGKEAYQLKEIDELRMKLSTPVERNEVSLFWTVCRDNPEQFNRILEEEIIELLGLDPVIKWLSTKHSEYCGNSYRVVGHKNFSKRYDDRIEIVHAISTLLVPKKIELMGILNVHNLVRMSNLYLREIGRREIRVDYFNGDCFRHLLMKLMSPDIIDALGSDFVCNFLIQELAMSSMSFGTSYFDWLYTNHYERKYGTEPVTDLGNPEIEVIFNKDTLRHLGRENVANIFINTPILLGESVFNCCVESEDDMDFFREKVLESLPSSRAWNRHKELGLTKHWRLRSVPSCTNSPICITFEVRGRTYRMDVNVSFLEAVNSKYSRRDIFTHVSDFVRFFGGENKEIWT